MHNVVHLSFNLRLKSEGISHEDLLLGQQSLVFKLGAIRAASASTVTRAVPVVLEALAVQLEAARVRTIAPFRFVILILNSILL